MVQLHQMSVCKLILPLGLSVRTVWCDCTEKEKETSRGFFLTPGLLSFSSAPCSMLMPKTGRWMQWTQVSSCNLAHRVPPLYGEGELDVWSHKSEVAMCGHTGAQNGCA